MLPGIDLRKWHPNSTSLHDRSVHVWFAALDWPNAHLANWAAVLSGDELLRARRLRFEEQRKRFVAARAVLRAILGHYLGKEPQQIEFQYTPHGKPMVSTSNGLQFNLSHAHDLMAIGVTCCHSIGIDVEHVRPFHDFERIAERFFSAHEYKSFTSLPSHQKLHGFFNCWTRKEAFIKAVGTGLSYPLHSFDVSLKPDMPARFLSLVSGDTDLSHWSLHALQPGEGYVGAVAVASRNSQLSCTHVLHFEAQ